MGGDGYEPALTASGLNFRYRRSPVPVLKELNGVFEAGITVLLGPNGAGKTTLLKVIAGLLKAAKGSVELNLAGSTIDSRSADYRGLIGYLPQSPVFVSGFTALDHLTYCGWLAGFDTDSSIRKAREWLSRVDLTAEAGKQSSKLSGGMSRRLAIAAAAIADPPVLLLDEPSVGLDPAQRSEFRKTLISMKSNRIILMSTHQVDDLFGLVDSVAIISKGSIVSHGPLQSLLDFGRQDGELVLRVESAYGAVIGNALR